MSLRKCIVNLDGDDFVLDITNLKQNNRLYGGAAGQKIGVTYDNSDWIVKFPGNLKGRDLKNIVLSCSNSPICEYIGSHIYEFLDIPVHETKLAHRGSKLVVMCKDFTCHKRLYHFSEIKATFEPAFTDLDGNETDGCGTDLDEALLVIRNHPIFQNVENVEDRFWKMFIVDFIIGNPDRNNGNWGILVDDDSVELAPVFDNGNCLNDKWDDAKIQEFLLDKSLLNGEAYGSKVCFYTRHDKKVKPYKYIRNTTEEKCIAALQDVLKTWRQNRVDQCIDELLNSIDCVTGTRKIFIQTIIALRIHKLEELVQRGRNEDSNLKSISVFD